MPVVVFLNLPCLLPIPLHCFRARLVQSTYSLVEPQRLSDLAPRVLEMETSGRCFSRLEARENFYILKEMKHRYYSILASRVGRTLASMGEEEGRRQAVAVVLHAGGAQAVSKLTSNSGSLSRIGQTCVG